MEVRYCPTCGSKKIKQRDPCLLCTSVIYHCKKCNAIFSFDFYDNAVTCCPKEAECCTNAS